MNDTTRRESLTLSLTNELPEIAILAERIEAFCAAHGLPAEVEHAINLSLDELLTNTISYGYDDAGEHRIDVSLRLDGDAVTIEVADDGAPFDPFGVPEPDIDAALEDRAIGGLGVFLVKQMMDRFEYRRDGGRNIVTLTKRTSRADGA